MKKTLKTTTNPSFLITGLAGKKNLKGTIRINGAKNAALKAMAASILFDSKVRLENIPHTADIDTMTTILKKLGAKIEWVGEKNSNGEIIRDHTMEIDSTTINSTDIDPQLAGGMRASVVLTGPLLARFGKVSFPAPGGCVIGARPIDLFIEGYKTMGATVTLKNGLYYISAPKGLNSNAEKVTEFFFHTISVGGTETLMMAATIAKGKTILKNCAKEPEIVNVAEWLISSGAKIKGVGTETIEIEGIGNKKAVGGNLLKYKKPYIAIPDRIEAGSYIILGALCASELRIERCEPKHLESLLHYLNDSGVLISVTQSKEGTFGNGEVNILKNTKANSSFKSFNIQTREYPGFPTDLQSPIVTYLTQVSGKSSVTETIFEGRFKYVDDLVKLGANIGQVNDREIEIKGPSTFIGEVDLCAHDIRAGFAIVTAALLAEGKFKVSNAHLIDRGYERLEENLKGLGADIKRVL
jgi:UDP-N-acetylglucosamine 1-carboxyvinyltransferase